MRLLVIVLTLVALGCEGPLGPDGPTGPQGPQGGAGQDGSDGATGPQGPQGGAGQDGSDGATGPQGPQGGAGQDGSDGATGPQGPQGPEGPQGEPLVWADVLEEHRVEEATYVLGYSYTSPRDGDRYFGNFCSGFAAYYTSMIWTNAHCVDGIGEIVELWSDTPSAALRFYVIQAGTSLSGDQRYEIDIDRIWKHPDYDGTPRSEDIGIVDIDGTVPVLMDFLPQEYADAISVGQPIGTMGFPGELGSTGGAADQRITATFKDGTVSALRMVVSGDSPHVALQHNFDTSGGTSGSAIIDHNGWIVAFHNAGISSEVTDTEGNVVQIGHASLGEGIRVDAVWGFLDILESGRAGMSPPHTAIAPRSYPHAEYQPFPEN